MKNIARTIEVIANVAIIFVAISLGLVLISRSIRSYRGTVSESGNTAQVEDQRIELPGVDWSKHEQTLVMAISSTGHFVLKAQRSIALFVLAPVYILLRCYLKKEVLLSVGAEG